MIEAIKILDDLRIAVNSLPPVDEMRVQRGLAEASVINFSDGIQFASALGALRALFRKIDDWERRQGRG